MKTSSQWVSVPVPWGKTEVKERLEPLPSGPYIYVPQHQEHDYLLRYFTMTKDMRRSVAFEFVLGFAVYVATENGPLKVAYHYDTSD